MLSSEIRKRFSLGFRVGVGVEVLVGLVFVFVFVSPF